MVREGVEGSARLLISFDGWCGKRLRAAYRSRIRRLLSCDGKAQPIFPIYARRRSGALLYDKSDIIALYCLCWDRCDTDGDGKPDFGQDFVQCQTAVNGDYKAASIFEVSPYVTGWKQKSVPWE